MKEIQITPIKRIVLGVGMTLIFVLICGITHSKWVEGWIFAIPAGFLCDVLLFGK